MLHSIQHADINISISDVGSILTQHVLNPPLPLLHATNGISRPKIFGGTNSTNVIVLDLEYPFPWVHPCEYGTLNDTTLTAVVNATRTR